MILLSIIRMLIYSSCCIHPYVIDLYPIPINDSSDASENGFTFKMMFQKYHARLAISSSASSEPLHWPALC